jgi:hypothetical protein
MGLDILTNWPEKNVEVVVSTNGEKMGLGDLGQIPGFSISFPFSVQP